MATLEVRTLSDQVYSILHQQILDGKWPADKPVRQDTLAAMIGVSKIPVREALLRLVEQGLVTSHPHRGFIVRGLTRAEAEDIFDLRLHIEPMLTVLGSKHASDEDHVQATVALQNLQAAAKTNASELGRFNREFHLALARPSQRLIALETLDRLLSLSERYVRAHVAPSDRKPRAQREHAELFTLWRERKLLPLRRYASTHIRSTLADLRNELSKARPKIAKARGQ